MVKGTLACIKYPDWGNIVVSWLNGLPGV
jgi:hypothetical protein